MFTRPSKTKNEEFLLPTEVVMDILSKLPTMSLLRFHCISKQWFNILRDEYFQNLHSEVLLRSPSPLPSYPKILFSTVQIQKQQPIITFSCLGSTSHHTIKIHTNNAISPGALNCMLWPVLQCNGLVGMVPDERLNERPIIVCNPLTLEYLALCLGTTWSDVLFSFGLGFAPLAKQYKVVCIHQFVKAPSEQPNCPPVAGKLMEVYTLGDTTWRVVDPHVDFKPWCFQSVGLYANGKIYWVLWGPRPVRCCIYSFDVESEKGSVVGLPPTAAGSHGQNEISDFKLVQLGCGVSLFMNRGLEIEVWMLKEYHIGDKDGNCLWNMRQRIRLPDDFVDVGGGTSFRFRLLGAWEFGDDDWVIALRILSNLEIKKTIFYYQISSTIRRCEHEQFSVDYLPGSMSSWYPCFGYKPSLVSLKGNVLREKM